MASPFRKTSRTPSLAREDGFTLVELMVAALILVLIGAAVAQALIDSTHFSGDERLRSQADSVAQQDLERLKGMSDQQLSSLNQTRQVVLDNTQFSDVSSATFIDATGTSSCASGASAYYKLTSTVSWTEASSSQPVSITEEAILTRAVTGALLQKVQDQTGGNLSGVTVSVDGQNTNYNTSGMTDSNGCALLTGLPADSYALAFARNGYVDKDGNASPPGASAAVSQTSIAIPPAQTLGPAGSMNVGFAAFGGTGTFAASGNVFEYYGSLDTHMTQAKVAGSTSAPATSVPVASLFPFYSQSAGNYAGNYQLWAGQCPQEQPLQPPSGYDVATVNPATANVPARIAEPTIDAVIKYNNSPVPPADVHVTFTATSGSACKDAWTKVTAAGSETIGGTTYNVYPVPFASNAAQGTSGASATGDTGTVTFCVDYKPSTTYVHESTVGIPTNSFSGPNANLVWDLKKDAAVTSGTCP